MKNAYGPDALTPIRGFIVFQVTDSSMLHCVRTCLFWRFRPKPFGEVAHDDLLDAGRQVRPRRRLAHLVQEHLQDHRGIVVDECLAELGKLVISLVWIAVPAPV